MKSAAFDYFRPDSAEAAVALLAERDGMARPVSGSQSLGPMLNMRLAQPELVVDLRRLPALTRIEMQGTQVRIGAAVTHAAIEDSAVPGRAGRILSQVAGGIAYRAVRNRGTIGGSLAHADPAADWPSTLIALDAQIAILGPAGERLHAASDFILGAFETVLKPDEIVAAVIVPEPSPGARWAYWKHCRKPGEFANVIAAFLHQPDLGKSRGVLGAIEAPPLAISDASAFVATFDDAAAAALVARTSGDAYDHQIRRTALARAAAALSPV